MVLDNIEKLLEKYDNGETSLQEEQQLKNYFAEETVPPHLEGYKAMFVYFSVTREEQYTKDVPLKTKTTKLNKISIIKWGIDDKNLSLIYLLFQSVRYLCQNLLQN